MLKVIIAGGRDFKDFQLLKLCCDEILANKKAEGIEVVCGCAPGADTLGEQYAKHRGYPVRKFEANWELEGKAAGPIRNKKMADYADCLICFWNGFSKGTANMIMNAQLNQLKIRIIKYR